MLGTVGYARPAELVMVNGRVVVEHGRVLGMDEEQTRVRPAAGGRDAAKSGISMKQPGTARRTRLLVICVQSGHGVGGHAGAVAGEAQVLLGGGLDVDPVRLCPERRPCFPAFACGRPTLCLGDEGGVDVHHPVSGVCQSVPDPGQQHQAGDVQKGVVTVRKQAADVSQGGGTQQRVHHRVGQHVGVGVTVQPPVIGDVDAAQDQRTSGGEPVDIVAVAMRRFVICPAPGGWPRRSAGPGGGDLDIFPAARGQVDFLAQTLHGGAVVGDLGSGVDGGLEGGLQQAGLDDLGGVYGEKGGAVRRGEDAAVGGVAALIVSVTGTAGAAALVRQARRMISSNSAGCQGTGGVVNGQKPRLGVGLQGGGQDGLGGVEPPRPP